MTRVGRKHGNRYKKFEKGPVLDNKAMGTIFGAMFGAAIMDEVAKGNIKSVVVEYNDEDVGTQSEPKKMNAREFLEKSGYDIHPGDFDFFIEILEKYANYKNNVANPE